MGWVSADSDGWNAADSLGLISFIIGSVWFLIALFLPLLWRTTAESHVKSYLLLMLIGGITFVVMGIVAVANDSKLGIGGIIFGGLWTLVGLTPYIFA